MDNICIQKIESGEPARVGRGRPAGEPTKVLSVRVTETDAAWLALWRPDSGASDQLREVVARGRKFFPNGPNGRPQNTRSGVKPGGVRDLKQQLKAEREKVAALTEKLRALGVEV